MRFSKLLREDTIIPSLSEKRKESIIEELLELHNLKLLSRVGRLCSDEAVRRELIEAPGPACILAVLREREIHLSEL